MPEPVPDLEGVDYHDIEEKYVFRKLNYIYLQICRYKFEYDEGFDNIVVVDGVPVIDRSKLEKLLVKVTKEFNKKGVSVKVDDIFMPWDDKTGKSKGCASSARPVALANLDLQIHVHRVQKRRGRPTCNPLCP